MDHEPNGQARSAELIEAYEREVGPLPQHDIDSTAGRATPAEQVNVLALAQPHRFESAD